ncbi:TPA: glycosyl transferase [Pasteurella multocida]|nr:glycosyl transferase [Pasteurella multocida subsp. multocida]MBM9431792.1 glycosyl transferase [Pasteurella multocida]MRN36840.1 glycosyl transferase [Pasteurella multocida]NKD99338.1 glycosyl transferase [Pasteurella multocida]NKG40639.1 glycosyl transferase [Pasteurella multocida]
MTPKIGILYIATGRYYVFWEDFYKSAEKHFLPNLEKQYFIFSDYESTFFGEENGNVHRIYQSKLGWPYDTLMRFEIFLSAKELFKDVDYLFFVNANMIFIKDVHESELLIPGKELLAALQPWFIGFDINETTYERNPDSKAYIPYNEGEYYVMGSFNGGKKDAFLEMCHILNKNIYQDLENGIIALWHDESHLNHYFWKNKENVFTLFPDYLLDEAQYYFPSKKTHYINPSYLKAHDVRCVMRNKNHHRFGGKDYMRGVVEEKLSRDFASVRFDLKIYRRHLKRKLKEYIKALFSS